MKNCVYYIFFGDIKYQELLLLSLESLNKFFPKEHTYVYSEYPIKDIEKYANLRQKKFEMGFAIPMAARYSIAQDLCKEYDNALYLDLDTICINNIDSIFKDIAADKISVASEYPDAYDNLKQYSINVKTSLSIGSVADYNWAGPLLDLEEKNKYKNIPSICSGVFAFNKSIVSHLFGIFETIKLHEQSGFMATCADQHGFCKYLLTNDVYNFNLQAHVTHQGKDMSDKDILYAKEKGISVLHFAGGVTSHGKKEIMSRALMCSIGIK